MKASNFFQFIQGSRCQNMLPQDPDFCKILKIQIEQRLRRHSEVKNQSQIGIPKEKATEVLMEVNTLVTLVTMSYAKRKHLAALRDKKELTCSIKLLKQQIDASTLRDSSLENELAFLTEVLKNLEIKVAKEECKANSVKAQFRMQRWWLLN